MVCHVNAFVFRVPQIRDTMSTSFHATEGFDRTNVGGGAATQSIYFQCGGVFEAVQDARNMMLDVVMLYRVWEFCGAAHELGKHQSNTSFVMHLPVP